MTARPAAPVSILALAAALLAALVALALPGAARPAAADPSQELLAQVETGLLWVTARCPAGGTQTGTAVLVGPKLALVARHIVTDARGRACTATVRQHGSGAEATVTEMEHQRGSLAATAARTRLADLTIAALDRPLAGHAFRLSRTPAKPPLDIVTFGYAYAEGLSITEGRVVTTETDLGLPRLGLMLDDFPGGTGGPILDLDTGALVALVQERPGDDRTVLALDLAAFTGGDPKRLCNGIALAYDSTLCGTARLADDDASSTRLAAKRFTLRYPAGWKVLRAEADRGGYLDTTIVDPAAPARLLRVNTTPKAPAGSARANAMPVVRSVRRSAGYRELDLSDVDFFGYRALRWEFTVRQGGVLVRKVDIFFRDRQGNGWAVLFQAPDAEWYRARGPLAGAVASLRLTPAAS